MNEQIAKRLKGLRMLLMASHAIGKEMSTAAKGAEREQVVNLLLKKALTSSHRFGTGDVADCEGGSSGQVDIVLEAPFAPRLPVILGYPSLYFAESVAVIIEVKSNLRTQWREVADKAEKVSRLERNFTGYTGAGDWDAKKIPFCVIGFEGWSSGDSLRQAVKETEVHSAFQVDKGFFCGQAGIGPHWMGGEREGDAGLLASWPCCTGCTGPLV